MKLKHCYWLLLLMLIVTACSEDDSASSTPPVEKYTVSLALGGEISVTDEPMTRGTATNHIYGINVYYDKDGDGNTDDLYGYGLFDNIEDMTIELLSNHKYKFECSLVKDGKTTLYYGPDLIFPTASGYHAPFGLSNNGRNPTLLENKFILGTNKYFGGLWSGYTFSADIVSGNAGVNRFYGELADYTPTQGGVATIFLKRVVFGVKFIITGVQDETIDVFSNFWDFSITEDYESDEKIFTFDDVRDCWKNETPYEAKITLSSAGTHTVIFKRNTLTTITINLSSPSVIHINEENWSDDNLIDLEINTDGVIDTPVVPTE
ncbi:MAG: hypothetical protein IKM12_06270 [Alistipes sp.]|nr:hypothetical protein [Alistipes sp.]